MNDAAKKLLAATCVVIVAVYFVAGMYFHSETDVAPPADPIKKSEHVTAGLVAPSAPPSVKSHGASQPATQNLVYSKFEEVERLQSSGRPADAFKAYKIIEACLHARAAAMQMGLAVMPATKGWMAKVPEPEVACGDISPGQISSRASNLETVVQAGIPGSAMAFLKEGPFGDPALNNAASLNDPSVVEWMARSREYVRQAAEKGDREAIGNMSNYYQFVEVDHYKALMYYSASLELMPNSVRQAREITISQTLQLLGRGLTESRANDAVVAGKKLAKVDQ